MDKRDVLREVQRRVLDNDARRRRLRKTLEILEQDNHVEDCLSDAKTTKRPKFEDVNALFFFSIYVQETMYRIFGV